MIKLQSRTVTAQAPVQRVFSFLSDFRNFEQVIPSNVLSGWRAEADQCSFSLNGFGQAGLRIVERDPNRLIKITGEGAQSLTFFLWIQMKEAHPDATHLRLTLHADVPVLLSAIASGPLNKFLDMMIDRLETFPFPEV